jgi:hypothetical protein
MTSEGGIGIAIKREAQGLPDRTRRGNRASAIKAPELQVTRDDQARPVRISGGHPNPGAESAALSFPWESQ